MKSKNKGTFKRIMTVFLAAAMISASCAMGQPGIFAYTAVSVKAADTIDETPAGSFEYIDNTDGTITITKFTGTETDVVVPAKINNKTVSAIGEMSFLGCQDVISITLQSGVTTIRSSAFTGCMNLERISIPDTVTEISENALTGCHLLQSISVDAKNTKYLSEDNILFDKNKTTVICCPETRSGSYSIPAGVKKIAGGAFYNCENLTEIKIPSGVTDIGPSAFRFCTGIKSITIPSSVTSIEDSAFENCQSLASISVPTNLKNFGSDVFKDTEWYTKQSDGVIYINNILYGYKGKKESLTSLNVKSGTKIIADRAFMDFSKLSSVTLTSGLVYVGNDAFENCTTLKQITIPASVVDIQDDTFSGCTLLSSVTISSGVKSIGKSAFYGCSSLKNITIPKSVANIGEFAFGYPTPSAGGNIILTISGYEGSAAQEYAKNNTANVKFELIKSKVIFGDVNGDEIVNIADALMISRNDAGLTDFSQDQTEAADVNGDGRANIADALMISRYDAKLITEL